MNHANCGCVRQSCIHAFAKKYYMRGYSWGAASRHGQSAHPIARNYTIALAASISQANEQTVCIPTAQHLPHELYRACRLRGSTSCQEQVYFRWNQSQHSSSSSKVLRLDQASICSSPRCCFYGLAKQAGSSLPTITTAMPCAPSSAAKASPAGPQPTMHASAVLLLVSKEGKRLAMLG